MNQAFLVDTAETFQTYVYDDNQIITPLSATIAIYKPNSTEELVASTAMTVDSDGLLSFDLTTTYNEVADEGYKAEILYTHETHTHKAIVFYDVVFSRLFQVITDNDIVRELPPLREQGQVTEGTSESGSTTTIVDADLKRFDDDYFTGGTVHSITQDETRKITDFTSSTGTLTFVNMTATAATDQYTISRSYTEEIDHAFSKVEDWIRAKGRRPHLLLDSEELRFTHIYQSVAEVCKSFANDEESVWWARMEKYDKLATLTFKNLNFKYDYSNDGTISGAEEESRFKRTIVRN